MLQFRSIQRDLVYHLVVEEKGLVPLAVRSLVEG